MALDYKLIGTRLKQVRKSNNITQEKLSLSVYIKQGEISHIENSISNKIYDLQILEAFCKSLKIELKDLLFMEEREFMEKYNVNEIKETKKSKKCNDNIIVLGESIKNKKQNDLSDKTEKEIITEKELLEKALIAIDRYEKNAYINNTKVLWSIGTDLDTGKSEIISPHISGIATFSYQEELEKIEQDQEMLEYYKTEDLSYYNELKRDADREKKEIKELLDSEEIIDEEEYYYEYKEDFYIILNGTELENIANYISSQKFDMKNYELEGIIEWGEEGAMMRFCPIEKDDDFGFYIYYNRESETCESYKEIIIKQYEDDALLTELEPIKKISDAINK